MESVVLLLQEEFASRLAMEFGIASRGPLGINTALNWDCSLDLKVPPHAFTPHPEVHSRLVFLKPRNLMKDLEIDVEPRLVKRIVDHAFAERRRKMKNRLNKVTYNKDNVDIIDSYANINIIDFFNNNIHLSTTQEKPFKEIIFMSLKI